MDDKIVKLICKEAKKLGSCDKIDSIRTLEQLVRLFLSPQGVEFCQKHSFPSIETLRKIKALGVEKFGVFIDAGCISVDSPGKVAVIGDTHAYIVCNKGCHNIIVMHRACADITANIGAVVHIESEVHCCITTKKHDYSTILW